MKAPGENKHCELAGKFTTRMDLAGNRRHLNLILFY